MSVRVTIRLGLGIIYKITFTKLVDIFLIFYFIINKLYLSLLSSCNNSNFIIIPFLYISFQLADTQQSVELRVAVMGANEAGKSTLIGVLTQG